MLDKNKSLHHKYRRSHRSILFVMAIFVLFLLACTKPHPSSYSSEIYLVRHFQKQAVTTSRDVDLTELGKKNAMYLAQHLQSKDIKSIYSTNYKRTKQTAQPSSDAFKVAITLYDPSALQSTASQLLASNRNQLVVGHSNTTGELFALLGCEPTTLLESDYGDVFVVSRLHTEKNDTLLACSRYQLNENT